VLSCNCLLTWALQFVDGAASCDGTALQHQDDLLFFVYNATAGRRDVPYFVKRRSKQLPEELQLSGSKFPAVDWRETTLLNIVLHSQYQLTVVACG
jgi:hypothetical protein